MKEEPRAGDRFTVKRYFLRLFEGGGHGVGGVKVWDACFKGVWVEL